MSKKKELSDVEELLKATQNFDFHTDDDYDELSNELSDEDLDIMATSDKQLEHYIDVAEKKNPTSEVGEPYDDNDFVTYLKDGNLLMGKYGKLKVFGYEIVGKYI